MLEEGIIEFIKNNKKLLIVTFFVVIVGIGIIVFVTRKPPSPPITYPDYPDEPMTHNPITEERCKAIKDPAQREACFAELNFINAVISQNIDKCLELSDKSKRDECVFSVSKGKLNVEYCKRIEDNEERERCIMDLAINTFDPDICDRYFSSEPFERQECRDKVKAFDIVINKKDIKLCQGVKTLEYGPLCYGYMFAQGQDCSELRGEAKDLCESMYYFYDAKTEEDCNKLPLENYKKVCVEMIKQGKPASQLDSDDDKMSDAEELNFTVFGLAPTRTGDGLTDYQEAKEGIGANPLDPDSDGDGVNDGKEIKLGTDPNKIDH